MNIAPAAPFGLFAQRSLSRAQEGINQSLERLATGQRLTRASVDPAAVIAVSRMQADVAANLKQIEALERESSRMAIEEGAAGSVSDMLVDLEGLAVRAANTGAMSDAERKALQIEADSIVQGIDHVANITGLDSSYTSASLGSSGGLSAESEPSNASLADIASGGSLNLVDGDIKAAQGAIRNAIRAVSTRRGEIGLQIREHDSLVRSLTTEFESLSGAISKLADADFAKETPALARGQVLAQASIFAILASDDSRARVLDLLA